MRASSPLSSGLNLVGRPSSTPLLTRPILSLGKALGLLRLVLQRPIARLLRLHPPVRAMPPDLLRVALARLGDATLATSVSCAMRSGTSRPAASSAFRRIFWVS